MPLSLPISSFSFPTTIIHGAGAIRELRKRLEAIGAKKPMIVTDAGLVATPAFKHAMTAMPAECQVFSQIQSNPTDSQAQAATEALLRNGSDSVIALGGGSAIDVAKIIRLRAR